VGACRGGLGTRLRGWGGDTKSLTTLGATELSDLQDAFAAVYGLRDDRGYTFYAGLHGLPLPEYCQHDTLLFLPWHRAYLCFFERALTDAQRRARDGRSVKPPP
jgi:tyrosinase